MLRSLRFRLAAFFLAGVVLSGLVAAAVSFQLIQSYTLKRARGDLRREATGLTELYAFRATQTARKNQKHDFPQIPAHTLKDAIGDRVYYLPAAAATHNPGISRAIRYLGRRVSSVTPTRWRRE